jgi:energy-converting hydrogenase Eha subunit A
MSINPTIETPAFIGHQDFSWWLGTVVNADDRDAKLGRVKVNILNRHRPDAKPADLPWALVMQPSTNAAVSGVGVSANQLKPGSFVMGFFLDHPDDQQPIVMGTLFSQVKAVIEPKSQNSFDRPGASNISEPNTGGDASETGQSLEATTTNDDKLEDSTVSTSIASKSFEESESNPSGYVTSKLVADGKDSVKNTVAKEISTIINDLANIFKTGTIYDPNSSNPRLTKDLNAEEQFIPVSNSSTFPPRGKVKIGSEVIGYNGKNSFGLTLVKRGMEKTKDQDHKKGTAVKYLPKTDSPRELVGKFSDKVIDIQSTIQSAFAKIRNLIWHIVNKLKSFIMQQVTKLLNLIGLSAISPIPLFAKGITEIILQVLRQIGCTFDSSLVDAIMGGIEGFVEAFVENMLNSLAQKAIDFLNFAENCINQIFGSIFQLVEVANQILDIVDSIQNLIKAVGNIKNLSNLSDLATVGNIVAFILNLLGIGCNRKTDGPINIDWETCPITANDCSPFSLSITSTIPGRWSPEYSKMFVQSSETGQLFVQDDTPGSNRMVIEGPNKSGIDIQDNGDVRITNSNNKTEVIVQDDRIYIKGSQIVDVGGDYHLKVGGNYHLEVRGQYNVFANRESKVTYNGEHETIYENDSELSAANGLAIAGSKVGISGSGQIDMFAPTVSHFCTEMNTVATGSINNISTFHNEFILLNKLRLNGLSDLKFNLGKTGKFVGGTDTKMVCGKTLECKIGSSSKLTVGNNNTVSAGSGQELECGVKLESNFGAKIRNMIGLKSTNAAGACIENVGAVKVNTEAGTNCNFAGGPHFVA